MVSIIEKFETSFSQLTKVQFEINNNRNYTYFCLWRIHAHCNLHCWRWLNKGVETYKISYKNGNS